MKPAVFTEARSFYKRLFRIALPIITQSFLMSSLNLLDGVLVGQLGDTAVASVGLANQIYFLLNLMLFGVSSGAGVFTAQLWGKRDIPNIRKVQGIALIMAIVGSGLFAILAIFFPRVGLGFYTRDPQVLAVGSSYLQVIGFSYVVTALTFVYSAVLKSTGNVRLPMGVSMVALSLKAVLSFSLIFGYFGLPRMGVRGAALATCLARLLEFCLLVLITYRKKLPPAARLSELAGFNRAFANRFLKVALPVTLNETLWSLGITTYNAVYAHIGTEAIAAVNIAATIENVAFVLFIGISDACGIIVGNSIGENEPHQAYEAARRTLILTTLGALAMGGVLLGGSEAFLSLYKVSDAVHTYAQAILRVISGVLWVRTSNMVLIVGILRSGGDVRFSFMIDAGTVWLVGVPLAFIGAFLLHLPVYWVYLLVSSEEVAKYLIGLNRFLSKKWINNLVQDIHLA